MPPDLLMGVIFLFRCQIPRSLSVKALAKFVTSQPEPLRREFACSLVALPTMEKRDVDLSSFGFDPNLHSADRRPP